MVPRAHHEDLVILGIGSPVIIVVHEAVNRALGEAIVPTIKMDRPHANVLEALVHREGHVALQSSWGCHTKQVHSRLAARILDRFLTRD